MLHAVPAMGLAGSLLWVVSIENPTLWLPLMFSTRSQFILFSFVLFKIDWQAKLAALALPPETGELAVILGLSSFEIIIFGSRAAHFQRKALLDA